MKAKPIAKLQSVLAVLPGNKATGATAFELVFDSAQIFPISLVLIEVKADLKMKGNSIRTTSPIKFSLKLKWLAV